MYLFYCWSSYEQKRDMGHDYRFIAEGTFGADTTSFYWHAPVDQVTGHDSVHSELQLELVSHVSGVR